jgi:ABC-type Fe3+ transport system permease subunit
VISSWAFSTSLRGWSCSGSSSRCSSTSSVVTINGWIKALWVIFVVIAPWLGVLVYLISQHKGMAERQTKEVARERDELRHAVGFSVADELEKLDRMKSEGKLSDEEYQRLRGRLVG